MPQDYAAELLQERGPRGRGLLRESITHPYHGLLSRCKGKSFLRSTKEKRNNTCSGLCSLTLCIPSRSSGLSSDAGASCAFPRVVRDCARARSALRIPSVTESKANRGEASPLFPCGRIAARKLAFGCQRPHKKTPHNRAAPYLLCIAR